jgi:sugar lactone lactonase YvrE
MDEAVTDDGWQGKVDAAAALLPCWFIPRMMDDQWRFGLLLTTGDVLLINCIDDVVRAADGSLWIDATMSEDDNSNGWLAKVGCRVVISPTRRTRVSLAAAQIVAAFEVADT